MYHVTQSLGSTIDICTHTHTNIHAYIQTHIQERLCVRAGTLTLFLNKDLLEIIRNNNLHVNIVDKCLIYILIDTRLSKLAKKKINYDINMSNLFMQNSSK